MRSFKLNFFAFFTVTLLFGSLQLYAQQGAEEQQKSKKMIIIKKYIDEDGVETIERIVKESDDFDINQLEGINEDFDLDINIDELEDQIRINIQQTDENGNPQIFKWDGKGNMPNEIQNELKEKGMSFNFSSDGDGEFKHHFKSCNPKPKAFLGVVADEDPNGLMLDEIVKGSAAEAAGLQEGDVLTTVDGQSVNSVYQLKAVLRNLQPGDNIALNYNRDGQAIQTTTTLKSKQHRRNYNRNFNHNYNRNYNRFQYDRPGACKPFIGVYLETGYDEDGVGVTDVIDDTPARKAGLVSGDVITAIDDVNVATHRGIRQQRDTHKAGDQFTITYLRDGVTRTVNAQFPACEEKDEVQPKQDKLIIIKKKKEESPVLDQVSNPASNLNISPSNKQTNLPDNTLRLDEMRTFPNPTANKVNVQFKGDAVPTTVRITDIMGRELLRQDLINFDGFYNEEINLKDIASPGTLLLHITQENKIHTEKIILSTPF